jgi:uncharacterized membrane protein YqhA
MAKKTHEATTLCPKALGLSAGIIWSLALFILGLLSTYTGYGTEFVEFFGTVFLGYETTLLGSFIGLIGGFIDAFVGLYIFGSLYNYFVSKACKSAK